MLNSIFLKCIYCVLPVTFKMLTPSWMICSHICTNFSLIEIILAAAAALAVVDERHPAAGPGAAPLGCSCRHRNHFIIKVVCFLKDLFLLIYFLGMHRVLIALNLSSANCTNWTFFERGTDWAYVWAWSNQLIGEFRSSWIVVLWGNNHQTLCWVLEDHPESEVLIEAADSAKAAFRIISSCFHAEGGLTSVTYYPNDRSCVFFLLQHFSHSNFQSALREKRVICK